MNYPTLLLLFTFSYLNSFAQIQDTCDYVSQYNEIGGLDCGVVSTAGFTPDAYQWLNCDSSFSEISGQTTSNYSGPDSIYSVALEITYLGCIDTSDCYHICHLGVKELQNNNKKLLQITDSLGRETKDEPNKLLIFIYIVTELKRKSLE